MNHSQIFAPPKFLHLLYNFFLGQLLPQTLRHSPDSRSQVGRSTQPPWSPQIIHHQLWRRRDAPALRSNSTAARGQLGARGQGGANYGARAPGGADSYHDTGQTLDCTKHVVTHHTLEQAPVNHFLSGWDEPLLYLRRWFGGKLEYEKTYKIR